MPGPSAVISVPICSEDNILSMRARSTLRIFPRNGRTAWNPRLRPCLALPPAESPSTMKISDLAGSRSWQSASLPGRLATSSAPLRRGRPAGLARRPARRPRLDHLADDDTRLRGMLLEPLRQKLVDQALDHRPHLRGD